jgi:hypothetical protein
MGILPTYDVLLTLMRISGVHTINQVAVVDGAVPLSVHEWLPPTQVNQSSSSSHQSISGKELVCCLHSVAVPSILPSPNT